jgi:hypothetical protein
MRKVIGFVFGLTSIFALASLTYSQTVADTRSKSVHEQVVANMAATPMKQYRKLALGMSSDDVESLWGEPKIKDERGFLYNLSDSETAQIEVGPEKKVTAIAIMFENGKGAPSLTEVFGTGATADPQQNGAVYKMVRYTDEGYWISYYAGSGDNAVTTITIRKLR